MRKKISNLGNSQSSRPVPSRKKISRVIKATMKDYARTMKRLA